MKCGCGEELSWEDFVDSTDFEIKFYCSKCDNYITVNRRTGEKWYDDPYHAGKSTKDFIPLEDRVWSFIKGFKISWKGLLGERIGRNYLQENGYKISKCGCHFYYFDLDAWEYVDEKLYIESDSGYFERKSDLGSKRIDNLRALAFETGLQYMLDDIALKGNNVYAVDYKSGKRWF